MRKDDSDGWSRLSVGGVSIPIGSDWIRKAESPLIIAGRDGHVEIREVEESGMLDLARVRASQVGFPGAASVDASLVEVGGRTAMCIVATTGPTLSLVYVVAGAPSGVGESVRFSEVRIVYVLAHEVRNCLGQIRAMIEDSTSVLASRVNAHSQTLEGHLRFGPVPAPSHWRIVLEDGSLEELSPVASPLRKVYFGGGAIALMAARDAPGIRGSMVVRRCWLGADITNATVFTYGRENVRRAELVPGQTATLVEARLSTLPLFEGPVGFLRMDLKSDPVERVVGSVIWRDVLGYQRELSYSLPADSRPQLQDILVALGVDNGHYREGAKALE